MRPLSVLLGFVLGSSGAITFSLSMVALVFWVLESEYPRLSSEVPALLISVAVFAGLTVIAGLGFYAELKGRRWRWIAFAALAVSLSGTGWYYWPAPS